MRTCNYSDKCPKKEICELHLNRNEKGNHIYFNEPPYIMKDGKFHNCPEWRMPPQRNGKKVLPDTNDQLLD